MCNSNISSQLGFHTLSELLLRRSCSPTESFTTNPFTALPSTSWPATSLDEKTLTRKMPFMISRPSASLRNGSTRSFSAATRFREATSSSLRCDSAVAACTVVASICFNKVPTSSGTGAESRDNAFLAAAAFSSLFVGNAATSLCNSRNRALWSFSNLFTACFPMAHSFCSASSSLRLSRRMPCKRSPCTSSECNLSFVPRSLNSDIANWSVDSTPKPSLSMACHSCQSSTLRQMSMMCIASLMEGFGMISSRHFSKSIPCLLPSPHASQVKASPSEYAAPQMHTFAKEGRMWNQ
mmetsp:Transcript_44177/g.102020  ORF Transcript_44177/g.102020 Transcript_44177/m.102020 type:complete len:295 (-) Transcript_44177:170-1054(-)